MKKNVLLLLAAWCIAMAAWAQEAPSGIGLTATGLRADVSDFGVEITHIEDDYGAADFITDDNTLIIYGNVLSGGNIAALDDDKQVQIRIASSNDSDIVPWTNTDMEADRKTWSYDATSTVISVGTYTLYARIIDSENKTDPSKYATQTLGIFDGALSPQIIFTWQGSTNAKSIRIRATTGDNNITVDWGDNINTAQKYDGKGSGTNVTLSSPAYGDIDPHTVTITADVGTDITYLEVPDRNILALDISGATELTELYCYNNQLSNLDISGVTELTELYCYNNNQLGNLDISDATNLTDLRCYNNQLSALDISKNTELTVLYCNDNQLSDLDISGATNLTTLRCYNNQLSALDISNNANLTTLRCYNNQLSALDISNNTNLTDLRCDNNQLSALDISNNTNLTYLSCYNNAIPLVDLKTISVQLVSIPQYDKVLGTQTLDTLDWALPAAEIDSVFYGEDTGFLVKLDNQLAVDGTDYSITLGTITFKKSGLYSIEMTNSTLVSFFTARVIASFRVVPQQITLEWKGSTGAKSIQIRATTGNNNITVDWDDGDTPKKYNGNGNNNVTLSSPAYGDTDTDYTVTITADVGTDITYLNVPLRSISALNVSDATALTYLDCHSNSLSNLDISKNTELKELYCYYNQLSALDISNNKNLTYLYCYNNQLTDLDISNNNDLTTLSCNENLLTHLEVSNNAELKNLWCDGNQLNHLDISENTKLISLSCISNKLKALDISKNTALTKLLCYNNAIPLVDLKAISAQLASISQYDKALGTQTLDTLNWAKPVARIDSVFNGSGTNFLVKYENNPVTDNSDYYSITLGDITFKKSGLYSIEITNPELVSRAGYEAKVIASFRVALSNDTTLFTLATNQGTPTPALASDVFAYSLTVGNAVEEISITATATHKNALVSGAVGLQPLAEGENTFTVTVTAEDNDYTATYTLEVLRRRVPVATDFSIDLTPQTYNGLPQAVSPQTSITDIGAVTKIYYNGNDTEPVNAGTYEISIDVSESALYEAASGLALGYFTITAASGKLLFDNLTKTYGDADFTPDAVHEKGAKVLFENKTPELVDIYLANGSYMIKIKQAGSAIIRVYTEAGNYEATEDNMIITIRKAAGVAPSSLPTGLEATYGDRFRDVTPELPEGFRWPSPSSAVGNASSFPVTVTALYNPDRNNYEDYPVELQLTIYPAQPPREVIFPEADMTAAIIYDPEQTLSSIGLINGSGAGTFSWRYPNTVPTVDRTEYPVVFTPADAGNYDYSGVEGWDARSRTIIRTISLTIVPRDITIDLFCDAAKTYTGLPVELCEAEVTISELRSSTAESIALEYLYYRNGLLQDEAINAGVYEVFARSADVNYSGQSATVTFTIEKAQPFILVNDTVAVYTGEAIAIACEITGTYTAPGLSRTLRFTYEGINGTSYGPTETAPAEIGEYSVYVYTPGSVNHLEAEATALLKIVSGVGIDQVAPETFKIYPNPVSRNSKLFLEVESGKLKVENGQCAVEVYDTNGSLLRKIEVRDAKMEIRSESKEGVYLYVLKSDAGVEAVKVIVE